jgi:hypothetical protein
MDSRLAPEMNRSLIFDGNAQITCLSHVVMSLRGIKRQFVLLFCACESYPVF